MPFITLLNCLTTAIKVSLIGQKKEDGWQSATERKKKSGTQKERLMPINKLDLKGAEGGSRGCPSLPSPECTKP